MIYCIEDIKLCDIYAPDYIIPVGQYPDNFKWTPWFRKRNLQGFIYAFYYKNILFKIGCSYNSFNTKKNTNWGCRFVRQVNNLPGRLKKPNSKDKLIKGYGYVPSSTNGRDIVKVVKTLEKTLDIKIDRNDVYVHIWNITKVQSKKYLFPNDDKNNKRKAEYFEGLVVQQYKDDNNGDLPIGNKKHDPSTKNHAFTKAKIAKEVGQLFSF